MSNLGCVSEVRPKPRDFSGEDRIKTKSMICWRNPVFHTTAEQLAADNGLEALLDRVLLLSYKVEEKTNSGIVLATQTVQQEHNATEFAVVISIGKYAYNGVECPIKVGDHVVVTKYAGEITYGATGERFRTVTDRMISFRMDPEAWPHIKSNDEFFSI